MPKPLGRETLFPRETSELPDDPSQLLAMTRIAKLPRDFSAQDVRALGSVPFQDENHPARTAVDRGSRRQSQFPSGIHAQSPEARERLFGETKLKFGNAGIMGGVPIG